ncbi:MAG TPA: hypothetical protein VH985_12995 [Candidatus Binatia bacterium]|jgi:hypothetical protein
MADDAIMQTTLGDLIVALTDAAGQDVRDEKMAYELVAYILTGLINSSVQRRLR